MTVQTGFKPIVHPAPTPAPAVTPGECDFTPHPSFSDPATEQELFGPQSEQIEVPLWTPPHDDGGEASPRPALLTGPQERLLFLRYNYARYRLSLLAAAVGRPTAEINRQQRKWRHLAEAARGNLVRANVGLVYAMVKRSHLSNVEVTELVSEGNMALLRSVDKFNVLVGAKFSTYACRAILKSFGHVLKKAQRQLHKLPIQFSAYPDLQDGADQKHERRWRESLEMLQEILRLNYAHLSDVERVIVNERFALATGGKARTLAQVAEIVGLTDERVRQLQLVAMAKIRGALERHWLAPRRSMSA